MDSLTTEQVVLISQAVLQYEDLGVLDTATYIGLSNAGLDADNITQLIEENSNG